MNPVFEFRTAANNVDPGRALIYMWTIYDTGGEVLGRYVGKASKGEDRPQLRYKSNVDRLLNGDPYRSSNPDGFRRVHHALATAAREKRIIELKYVCNVGDDEDINQVEQHYIKQYRCDSDDGIGLNGRRTVTYEEVPVVTNNVVSSCKIDSLASNLTSVDTIREKISRHFPAFAIEKLQKGYSYRFDNTRIVRIKQDGPKGTVRMKLSVTALRRKHMKEPELPETDCTRLSEEDLVALIKNELKLYEQFS